MTTKRHACGRRGPAPWEAKPGCEPALTQVSFELGTTGLNPRNYLRRKEAVQANFCSIRVNTISVYASLGVREILGWIKTG